MLVHSLASKYARFVVIVRQMYWTPLQTIGPPLLKSDDLFLGNQEILDPPLSKILDMPLNLFGTWTKRVMNHPASIFSHYNVNVVTRAPVKINCKVGVAL